MDKKFYTTLARISVPIMVQELIFSLTNILDTFMIGSIGVREITAVGLANQLFFLYILFIWGINSGSSVLMGQFWGAVDVPSIKKTLGICLVGSVTGAALFSALAVNAPELVMSIFSKDAEVIALGSDYLGVIWGSYIFCAVSMSFSTALKSIRQTKAPMFMTIIALSTNAVLNYVFIYILHMGVVGAAIATVIARLVELIVIVTITYAYRFPIAPKRGELFKADLAFVKCFAFVTTPILLNEFTWALGTVLYNAAYKFCGTDAQGALQISNSVLTLFNVVGMGVGSACGIMIANELGAGEIGKGIKFSRRFMWLAMFVGMFMGAMLAVSAPLITNIFNVTDLVKGYAIKIMYVFSAVLFMRMLNFTGIVGILRSGGDTWFCFALDLLSVYCVGLPLAFIGAKWLALPVYFVVALVSFDEIGKLPIMGYRVLKNGWARKIV